MPRISRFYGITVAMYFHDHAPPHFHALYGGKECKIRIDPLEPLAGNLPWRAERLVLVWAAQHLPELRENWERAQLGIPLRQVDPLQ